MALSTAMTSRCHASARRRMNNASTLCQNIQSKNPPSCPPQNALSTNRIGISLLRCFQMYWNS